MPPKILRVPQIATIVNNGTATTNTDRVGPRTFFTQETVANASQLSRGLNTSFRKMDEDLVKLRGFPFSTGVLLQNVGFNGLAGQVDTGTATAVVTLWNKTDTANFNPGDVIFAGTTDGRVRGTERTGSATVATRDLTAGTVTATGVWSAGIIGNVDGDYLFKGGYRDQVTTVTHGLGKIPAWWWAVATTIGSRPVEVTFVSSTESALTLRSTIACTADVYIVTR